MDLSENRIKTIAGTENKEKDDHKPKIMTVEERTVMALVERLEEDIKDVHELKNLVDQVTVDKKGWQDRIIAKINDLTESNQLLSEKLNGEGNYTKYIEEKLKAAQLGVEVTSLESALQKERFMLQNFIDEINSSFSVTLENMNSKLNQMETAETLIKSYLNKMQEETTSLMDSYTAQVNKTSHETLSKLTDESMDSNKVMSNAVESSLNGFKVNCEQMIKDYTKDMQEKLETFKKASIDFLNQAIEQNEKLLKRVPSVKEKFSKKDALICILSLGALISTFINVLL